jgi:hypothetical protein
VSPRSATFSLTRDTSARGWSKTVWNGAGSGCSGSVAKPAFQTGLATGCSKRAATDVAAVADPQTGVSVYQTFGASGWAVSERCPSGCISTDR